MTTLDAQPDLPTTYAGNGSGVGYSFTGTYRFIWVADPEVEGPDDPQPETRYLDYTGTLEWQQNSGFYEQGAGCSGQFSLSVTSASGTSQTPPWSASMTSTPNPPDPPSILPSGLWGPNSGVLSYTLSGMEPTVTLSFSGSLTTSGVGVGSISLQAPALGAPGGEGIWHTFPLQGKPYPVGVNLTPTGRWRGNTGSVYRIRFAFKYLLPAEVERALEPPTGNLNGTGRALNWTGNPFAPANLLKHWSVAYLDRKVNGEFPSPPDPVKTSDIWFNGPAN